MILVCPECSTQYEIPSLLPDEGSKVRCTSCSHVWMATNDDVFELSELNALAEAQDEATAQEPEIDPTAEDMDWDALEQEVTAEAESGEPVEEGDDIAPVSPIDDDPLDEIDFMDAEPEAEPEPVEDIVAEEIVVEEKDGEDNSQDDIDSMFDDAIEDTADEDNSQDDIDSLFDELGSGDDEVEVDEGAEEEENSQDDIDGLFDEVSDEDGGEDNSQDDIDGLFDEDSLGEPMAEPSPETPPKDEVEEFPDPFDSEVAASDGDEDKPVATGLVGRSKVAFYKNLSRKEMIGWGCYGAGVLFVISIMIFARVGVVKVMPAMASLYSALGMPVNVRGLMLSNINQKWEIEGNSLHLKIEGEITNLTNKYSALPPLVFGALSDDNREVFRWVMKVRKKPLLPGEKALFEARVPVPPEHASKLLISFQ